MERYGEGRGFAATIARGGDDQFLALFHGVSGNGRKDDRHQASGWQASGKPRALPEVLFIDRKLYAIVKLQTEGQKQDTIGLPSVGGWSSIAKRRWPVWLSPCCWLNEQFRALPTIAQSTVQSPKVSLIEDAPLGRVAVVSPVARSPLADGGVPSCAAAGMATDRITAVTEEIRAVLCSIFGFFRF